MKAASRREGSLQVLDAGAVRARLPWPVVLAALDAALRAQVDAPLRPSHRTWPRRKPRFAPALSEGQGGACE